MMRAGMQHRHLGELNAYAAAPSETSTIVSTQGGGERRLCIDTLDCRSNRIARVMDMKHTICISAARCMWHNSEAGRRKKNMTSTYTTLKRSAAPHQLLARVLLYGL
ncbi:hypothetical protein DPSP01_012585 [Paraphaeosphaeria sporulosa]